MAYQDGNFTNAIQDGPARVFYPFINAPTKDTTTKGTVRNYVVVPSSYTPAAALSTDPADNTQYLLQESELTVEGGLGRYSRTYCKVPTDQVDYSSIVITKPQFPAAAAPSTGYFYGYYNNCYIENVTKTSNILGNFITATFYPNVSGGTFTVSYKGQTTAAINYNATNANIASSVNGLSTMIADAVTVTALNNLTNTASTGISFSRSTGSNSIASLTVSFSLTPDQQVSQLASSEGFVAYQATRQNVLVLKDTHGLSNSNVVGYSTVSNATSYQMSNVAVLNVNAFTVSISYTLSNPFIGYRVKLRTYTPGTDRVLTKLTDKFYLPGVTAGITTGADIPVPDVAINDTQLLDLVSGSATGFQNYDAEPVTAWPSEPSPIFRQRFIQIDVDDL
jgi:hypothetical protein